MRIKRVALRFNKYEIQDMAFTLMLVMVACLSFVF